MSLILGIAGVAAFVFGILKVSGIKKQDLSQDSQMDKKLLSETSRYFIGRYWSGLQFIVGGVGLIVLGLVLYFAR